MLNSASNSAQTESIDPAAATGVLADFQAELTEVAQQLAAMTEDLYAPLSDLLRAEIKQSQPLLRAAFVLTASVGSADAHLMRQKRIFLATALETLTVALHIHRLLFRQQQSDHTVDKSLMGSVILAGDYCFSRAAICAARTDDPEVVTIFSRALMTISEGHLRELHNVEQPAQSPSFDEGYELISYGLQAAIVLAKVETPWAGQMLDLGERLAQQLSQTPSATSLPNHQPAILVSHTLPPYQQARWLVLRQWLAKLTITNY
jgi:Polyprenyl synthetase